MVVAAISAHSRMSPSPGPPRRLRQSPGLWVIVGVPVLLVLTFLWQLGSGMLHTEIVIRQAVSVSNITLDADPAGSRINMVVVDRVGQDTTVDGTLNIRLREPDGVVWQTTRNVTAADFGALPSGGLLAGRLGYTLVIPAADWVRAPRKGGASTVSIDVQPTSAAHFSTVEEERFP